MPVRLFHADRLEVRVYRTRAEMGAAAARAAEEAIRAVLARAPRARAVFAAAPSQNEFLQGLSAGNAIDWPGVDAFHLDEYAGLKASDPASFRRFLKDRLFGRVPVGAFHQIRGEAEDLERECERYSELLEEAPLDVAFIGIGENGHLAFIDPPVCDFTDPKPVRVVELDPACRMQQVHDGAFPSMEDVPKRALSMTVPAILKARRILAVVPGHAKSSAVRTALRGAICEACPASALRLHQGAALYLDADSAALLSV